MGPHDDGCLIRDELQQTTGTEEPELEPLARITIGGVVSGVGFFVLVGFALGLAANFGDIVDAMSGADWAYLPWISWWKPVATSRSSSIS